MNSAGDTRNHALDGIRAIAALGVVTFHSWLYRIGDPPGPRKSLSDHLLFQGNLGLICFFVLSGYLLYRPFARASLTGQRADSRFYRREQARLCEPGDALFFHGNLLHRSDKNTSPNPRWSLICCYNAAANDPYKESKHPRYSPLAKVADDAIKSWRKLEAVR